MKTAEDTLRNFSIDYGGIEYIDFAHAVEAMKAYGRLCAEQALKDASERAKANTESRFESVHYCDCIPVVDKQSILETPIVTP